MATYTSLRWENDCELSADNLQIKTLFVVRVVCGKCKSIFINNFATIFIALCNAATYNFASTFTVQKKLINVQLAIKYRLRNG
jgi:hypothetical protein